MFRKILILTAIVSVFLAHEVRAGEITCRWVGGEEGLWGEAMNWDPPIVPDNSESDSFIVNIDSNYNNVNQVEIRLQQDRTVDRLDCYGKVEMRIWTSNYVHLTLADANGLTNHGELRFEQKMEIKGDLSNLPEGTIMFSAEDGPVDINNLDNAGLIIITPHSGLWVDQTLHNTGQISVYAGDCGAGKILDNNTGVIRGFGLVYVGGFIYPEPSLQNKGEIYAEGGSLVLHTLGGPTVNTGLLANNAGSALQVNPNVLLTEELRMYMVNNQGTIQVNAGGSVAIDANLTNEPNGVIELLGGTLAARSITQRNRATFEGFGNITTENLTIDPNGIIEFAGQTNIVGDVTIDPNATFEIRDGTALITDHTTCNNGTIHMIGGRVICQGGLTNNNCNIIWEPGIYTNMADFNLDGQVNFKDFGDFANTWLWRANWY